jgi:hypothetical protein
MRHKIGWTAALLAILVLGCGGNVETPIQPTDDIVNHTGAIRSLGEWGFMILDDSGTGFCPSNLPEEFEAEGLRVLFSGRTGPVPSNVRMPGAPLELSAIQIDIR